ncbi:MAG: Stp1/IreP family PP2C-type Ser/Thr phosphatase [Eubacteriales bacterium]|nr:Stp1/IreP family PP2C-type Ser/Thr phosphatase [Eubacteriales bacterium]
MESYGATDKGQIRSVNQDYVFASEQPVGKLPNLFVVADGLGGYRAGDRASSYAVEVLQEKIREMEREKNPVRIIRRAIEAANEEVWKESHQKEEFRGMGTTMVAATIVNKTLYVANVGDSRLYLLSNRQGKREIHQVTWDHSLVAEMVRCGRMTKEESRNHPKKNMITRAVGVEDHVDIDFFDVKLRSGDIVLMCSDGLTNMLQDEELSEVVRAADSLQSAGDSLVKKANENGGLDNITVLLVRM